MIVCRLAATALGVALVGENKSTPSRVVQIKNSIHRCAIMKARENGIHQELWGLVRDNELSQNRLNEDPVNMTSTGGGGACTKSTSVQASCADCCLSEFLLTYYRPT